MNIIIFYWQQTEKIRKLRVAHEESIARYAHRIIRLLDGEVDKIEINKNPDK